MSFKIRAGYYRELKEHPLTMLRYNQDNYQNKLSMKRLANESKNNLLKI